MEGDMHSHSPLSEEENRKHEREQGRVQRKMQGKGRDSILKERNK